MCSCPFVQVSVIEFAKLREAFDFTITIKSTIIYSKLFVPIRVIRGKKKPRCRRIPAIIY